jgi:hypothetical protein
MDKEEFVEKMDKRHRAMLQSMLKAEELPDKVIEVYAKMKGFLDRIDGHLTPCGLAWVLMIADFKEPAEKLSLDEVEIRMAKENAANASEAFEPAGTADKEIEPAPGQDLEDAVEQAATGKVWAPGMPVNVLCEDQIKKGNISGIHPPVGSRKTTQLTVTFEDGDIVTVDEDEVEAE